MIAEIGLVLGLYVLARLLHGTRPALGKAITALAIVITVPVVIDLTVRIVRPDGIASFLSREKPQTQPSEVGGAPSQRRSTGSVTRTAGGSITTVLGYGFAVAKGSSLTREWIAVHDSILPVGFEGTPGVTTVYASRQYGSEYRYRARFTVTTREPIRALEVRFLTFDIWGQHVRSLSFEEVGDIAANSKKEITGEWPLYSENDVEKHYASSGYVARVRLADGRIVEAPTDLVLEEARRFSAKFTAAELEPKPAGPSEGRGRGGA